MVWEGFHEEQEEDDDRCAYPLENNMFVHRAFLVGDICHVLFFTVGLSRNIRDLQYYITFNANSRCMLWLVTLGSACWSIHWQSFVLSSPGQFAQVSSSI